MEENTLFKKDESLRPLADRMRPKGLEDFVGQEHLVTKGKILYEMIKRDELTSLIFWGPPGVGKTTLASIIAQKTKSFFVNFSAVTSGIKEIKNVMKEADERLNMGQRTVLFVDEIHRFNKAQQDAFLPYVEKGSIVLIGATTENPSFEVNSALLSRMRVFVLNALSFDDLLKLLKRTLKEDVVFKNYEIEISEDDLGAIAHFAHGDARFCLNTLEMVIDNSEHVDNKIIVSNDLIKQVLNRRTLLYDKKGEEHYNLISALHKSMRNSDVQAALYYLARMLEGGEDPLYVARRVVRFASEDIGMADSRALEIAVSAYQACHYLGMPECNVHLSHAVVYCSLASKSNSLEAAYLSAKKDALATMEEPVPLHIRNAPTRLMKDLGYGKNYMYAHDYEGHITAMSCLPDKLKGHTYYRPSNQGTEVKVALKMQEIEKIKSKLKNQK